MGTWGVGAQGTEDLSMQPALLDKMLAMHGNSEVSEWDSILEGGHFEEWLIDFSKALSTQEANKDG